MGLLNHVLVPCVFPGGPPVCAVPYPGSYDFSFTTSPGTTLIAAIAGPATVDYSGADVHCFKTDAGDSFMPLVGGGPNTTPPYPSSPCYGNGIEGRAANIFWVQSGIGGATALTNITSATDFDLWIYEVSGITGIADLNCFATPDATSLSSLSSGPVNGGGGAFYVAVCGVSDPDQTVNAPWTKDMTDAGGLYMCFGYEFDYAAAYIDGGSGIQTPTFTFSSPVAQTGFVVAAAAFSTAAFCGGGAQAVGNPLI